MALATHISKSQSIEIGYDIIQLSRYYYRFLNKVLGITIALPLAFILTVLLLAFYPIAWMCMKYVNSRLAKMLNEVTTIEINSSNYADYMILSINLNKNKADIKSINLNTKDKSLWYFRPMVSEISTYSDRFLKIHSTLTAKTQQSNPNVEGEVLRFLSTDELWNNRTKAYSYLA